MGCAGLSHSGVFENLTSLLIPVGGDQDPHDGEPTELDHVRMILLRENLRFNAGCAKRSRHQLRARLTGRSSDFGPTLQ